jgi:hypothetical protein
MLPHKSSYLLTDLELKAKTATFFWLLMFELLTLDLIHMFTPNLPHLPFNYRLSQELISHDHNGMSPSPTTLSTPMRCSKHMW